MRSGRPTFPTRRSYYGYGPSINGPVVNESSFPAVYEGYLFTPSQRNTFEDRWIRARPMKLPVSQKDLHDQVLKQRRSGSTAMEELCGLRVNNAKRAMISRLIQEKSMSEAGFPHELAALRLERDYVREDEADTGNYRRYDSRHKESKRRRKKTVSVYVVLQCPVKRNPGHEPVNAWPSSAQSSCAHNTGNASRPSEHTFLRNTSNAPPSTPRLEYIPAYARPRCANGGGNRSSAEAANRNNDRERQYHPRPSIRAGDGQLHDFGKPTSFSTRSSDTPRPTSPTTASKTSHHDGYFPAQPLKRSSCDRSGSQHRYVDVWPERSTRTIPTTDGITSNHEQTQQLHKVQQQTTLPTHPLPSYVPSSREAETNVSPIDPLEHGRRDLSHNFEANKGGLPKGNGTINTKEGRSDIFSSLPTSEDDVTSIESPMNGGDASDESNEPKTKTPDAYKQKPAWMNNLIPGPPILVACF